jgi:mannosylglycerate hydrolase
MPKTLTIVSHTHWDREWYQPFQEYRIRLVRLMDRLLDVLTADPNYRHFTLDGQTIILEDYLEVRPEREAEIRRLVQEGRLLIGPWYILPDEFLVGPEATVRNLMLGDRMARRFGPKMIIGYVPDPFGHISQLPQILGGFGMDVACFWRGTGDAPTEFRWAAPDGTEVLVLHLRDSYANAAYLPADEDGFVAAIQRIVDSLASHAPTDYLLVMNGNDHMEPMPELPALIAAANARLPDVVLRHGTLPQHVIAVRAAPPQLELRRGEMRCPQHAPILPGVLSARMWIKQRNAAAETLLEKWAEPFSAIAAHLKPEPLNLKPLIQQAWRYLIQNHPHDSICGCSIDQVHKEMDVRFDWVTQIGEEVTRQSLATIADAVDTASLDTEEPVMPVVVFNPVAGPRTDLVTVRVQLSGSLDHFTITDESSRPVSFQVQRRCPEKDNTAELTFVAPDVPGHGYRTFAIRPAGASSASNRQQTVTNIENEFFLVAADPTTGTFTLTDKASGTVFRDLNRFVDGGDRGDEYNYCPPEADRVVDAPAAQPTIRLVESGPVRQTLRIEMIYHLPVALTADRSTRTSETVALPIVTCVSLSPGVRRVDVQTRVDNQARDHRLRVHFPTPICTDVSHAEGHFDVVTRPVDPPPNTADWAEQPTSTHPQRTFVDANDGESGLMVNNRGLPEYEVLRGETGVIIALTLLRCVGWLSRDDIPTRPGHAGPGLSTPGAQCPGRHVFEYALVPHTRDWRACFREAHAFDAPLRAVLTSVHEGSLPPTGSFATAEPNTMVISAVKAAESGDGLIVRVYNIGDESVEGRLRLWRPFRRATLVNLNEEEEVGTQRAVPLPREIGFPMRGKQIATVKFT